MDCALYKFTQDSFGQQAMSAEQLMEIMRFQLNNFNDEDVVVTNATVHNDILSDEDGYGSATSRNIYKAAIRWTLHKAGHADKPWPTNWMDRSVEELAPALL